MIPGDWANMSQAVWRSPLLPLQASTSRSESESLGTIGSGARFKRDLLAYLNMYGNKKTGPLVRQLAQHDFNAIRAALVASVPSKQKVGEMDSKKETLWGWPALKDTLRHVPLSTEAKEEGRSTKPHIVVQARLTPKHNTRTQLTTIDIINRQPRSNKKVANRYPLCITLTTLNITKHSSKILDHLPNSGRNPAVSKRIRIWRINPHETTKRATAETTTVYASASLPMGWGYD